MSKPGLSVDIWSDVMCPWCAVGYGQFAKSVKNLQSDVEITVRWMPFELNPDLPPEGKLQEAHLAEVYGRSLEELAASRERLQAAAERAGFPIAYIGDGEEPPAMMWNTFEAHKLLRWALAVSGPAGQTRLKVALFEAHFQQRRNVSDREVLLDIAEAQGFDRSPAGEALADEALAIATRIEEQRGREAGISSVPSFVVAGRYLIQGACEAEDYAHMLRQAAGLGQSA